MRTVLHCICCLQALSKKFLLSPDIDLVSVAESCPPQLTGADMYALCADAWMNAFKRTVGALGGQLGDGFHISDDEGEEDEGIHARQASISEESNPVSNSKKDITQQHNDDSVGASSSGSFVGQVANRTDTSHDSKHFADGTSSSSTVEESTSESAQASVYCNGTSQQQQDGGYEPRLEAADASTSQTRNHHGLEDEDAGQSNKVVVCQDDFIRALHALVPSLSPAEIAKYEKLRDQYEAKDQKKSA